MTSYTTGQEPVPEGKDLSQALLNTPAPESSVPVEQTEGDVEQPEADPQITEPEPDPPAKEHTPGKVTLAAVHPMGTLTIPPDTEGGESVVIDQHGTEVDEATAQRAREAATTSGLRLNEE